MTVRELYTVLDKKYPVLLREEWDNDGLMLSPDEEKPVRRVLVALDATEKVADYAIQNGFDLIVTHHPLIFHPLSALNGDEAVSRKCIKLLQGGVSVFSFHTRLDAVAGGVNDCLAESLSLSDVTEFGGMGRVGELPYEMSLDDFAGIVSEKLSADVVRYAGNRPVRRVAVLGGDGKDLILAAKASGADTYLSGRLSYNTMADAEENGLNLVEGGHFATENPVTEVLRHDILAYDASIYVEVFSSYNLRALSNA